MRNSLNSLYLRAMIFAAMMLIMSTVLFAEAENDSLTGGLCPAFVLTLPDGSGIDCDVARLIVSALWVCDADLDSIHLVAAAGGDSLSILTSIPAPSTNSQALSIDGYAGDPIPLGMFVSDIDDDLIYHITFGGTVIDSFPAMGDDPECRGLCECRGFGVCDDSVMCEHDNGDVHCVYNGTGTFIEVITRVWSAHKDSLCLFDPMDSTYLATIPAPGPSASGLEWGTAFGGITASIWVCDNELDSIYLVSTDSGTVLARMPSPGPNPTGLCAGFIIPDPTQDVCPDNFFAVMTHLWESSDRHDSLYCRLADSVDVDEYPGIYLPPHCSSVCDSVDSLVIRYEAGGLTLYWNSPAAGDYVVWSAGFPAAFPSGAWTMEDTVTVGAAGLSSWVDPAGAADERKIYLVVHSCE